MGGTALGGEPGNFFYICWAFEPVGGEGVAAYKVPIGVFEIHGPSQGFTVQCVLGLQCNFQISGYGLTSTNQVQIVTGDGCQSANMEAAVLNGITNPRFVVDDAYDATYLMGLVTIGGSYSVCNTPNPASSCIGDHYKLCWAQGLNPDSPKFYVNIGKFAISGPFVTYRVSCMLDRICAFKFYGTSLSVSNRALIIEEESTCGDEEPQVAKIDGFTNPQAPSQLSSNFDSITFRMGVGSGGKEGTYRLCWGSAPTLLRDYNIDIGPFVFGSPPELCKVEDGLNLVCSLPTT